MKKIILLILFLIIAAGGYFFYQNFSKPKVVHYHAGFKVFVDGKLQDFSALKYMNIEPCSEHATETNLSPEEEQIEKAHLHDFVGDVVHSHRENVVWQDLFTNIKYKIDTSKPVEAYVNGKKVDNVLDYQIKPYDSLVLLIGKHGDVGQYLKQGVTKGHILEEEKKSESCAS